MVERNVGAAKRADPLVCGERWRQPSGVWSEWKTWPLWALCPQLPPHWSTTLMGYTWRVVLSQADPPQGFYHPCLVRGDCSQPIPYLWPCDSKTLELGCPGFAAWVNNPLQAGSLVVEHRQCWVLFKTHVTVRTEPQKDHCLDDNRGPSLCQVQGEPGGIGWIGRPHYYSQASPGFWLKAWTLVETTSRERTLQAKG